MKRTARRCNILRLAATISLLLIFGCEKTPQINPLRKDAVILAFGDSLTFGTGAPESSSYPAVLRNLLERTVVNAGVPGEISAEGLSRLPEFLSRYRPALVILCHGGNDFLRRLDRTAMRENVAAMIRLCREEGADVILLGVPELGLFLKTAGEYDSIAGEMGIPYDGDTLSDILGQRKLKSDQIHPNAEGYALMADAVSRLIRKAGGI